MITTDSQISYAEWESCWAPYDEGTYRDVLDRIQPRDTILDIGAGDLRLARRMANICQRVYAIENQPAVLNLGLQQDGKGLPDLPPNLILQPGDARRLAFPQDITAGVLLMRHCTHFQLYAEKLKAAGASRLITNARWRMGIEEIQLHAMRMPFHELSMGWYACWCGSIGFKQGIAQHYTSDTEEITHEVINCPQCESTVVAAKIRNTR